MPPFWILSFILDRDYLTGFHKRKQARRRFGLAMQEIKDRKERLEERKEVSYVAHSRDDPHGCSMQETTTEPILRVCVCIQFARSAVLHAQIQGLDCEQGVCLTDWRTD